jgi:hypothetical protein
MSKPKFVSTAGPCGRRTGKLQKRYAARVQRGREVRRIRATLHLAGRAQHLVLQRVMRGE